MWVSPFRYLLIDGYLLLPAAFRSLSRLSSALSAKASTLRSLCLTFVIRGTIVDGGFLMTCASAHHTQCDIIARASRSMPQSPVYIDGFLMIVIECIALHSNLFWFVIRNPPLASLVISPYDEFSDVLIFEISFLVSVFSFQGTF